VVRSFLIFVLILCLSVCAFGKPPKYTAIVTSGPSTTVSGTAVLDRMAAFPEDELETHSNDPAVLTFSGNTIRVLGKSHIKLRESGHELLFGGTVVSTSTRYEVQSNCFSAQPAFEKETKYSVLAKDGHIFIRAELGEVMVKARREVRVKAGKTLEILSCGKPDETTKFEGDGHLSYGAIAGSAAGLGTTFYFALPREHKSTNGECPQDPCQK
jgi:hypothetical protein